MRRQVLIALVKLAGAALLAALFALVVLVAPCFLVDRLVQCSNGAPGNEASEKILTVAFWGGFVVLTLLMFRSTMRRVWARGRRPDDA
jgi:hypothetical protein